MDYDDPKPTVDFEKERLIHEEILPLILKILKLRSVSYLRSLPDALRRHLNELSQHPDR